MAGELMDFDITCIEFSKEIIDRADNLVEVLGFRFLSKDACKVAIAIKRSGFFLGVYQGLVKVLGEPAETESAKYDVLAVEKEHQQVLEAAGITDDTTADRWLTPIEEKLKIARSEYQKLSDRQATEREEFCKQWMVK